MDHLDQIVSDARAAFAAISDPDALEQAKARFLGKSGQITELLKGLGKLPPEEKKTAGAAINVAKNAVEAALNERRDAIRRAALNDQIPTWMELLRRTNALSTNHRWGNKAFTAGPIQKQLDQSCIHFSFH